jgi:sugar phosphate permease
MLSNLKARIAIADYAFVTKLRGRGHNGGSELHLRPLNGMPAKAEPAERSAFDSPVGLFNQRNQMKLTRGQRITFGVTWITYAGFYLCRKNLSIVLPLLAGVSGLQSFQLANIVFGYSLLYAVGQFGFGFLSDRIGPKRVVGSGLLIIVVSNIAMGLHPGVMWLMVFACLNGVGQSTGWSGLVKAMASWFSSTNRGVVMAWWGTNYVFGGFLATAFATWSVSPGAPMVSLGWVRGFLYPALLLAVVVPIFFVAFSDTPPAGSEPEAYSDVPRTVPVGTSTWADLRLLLRKPSIWALGVSYFFLELCRYALMFWLPYYMVRQLHYQVQAAGYLSSLYELIGVGGALLAGYVSDRFHQSRRAPVSAMMLGLLAVVMLFQPMLAHWGMAGMAVVISLAGFLSYGPDTLLSGAAAQDVGEIRAAATATGLIDGIGHLGALASPYLVVMLSERYGWDRLFFVFAGTALLAGGVLLPLWNLMASGDKVDRLRDTAIRDLAIQDRVLQEPT